VRVYYEDTDAAGIVYYANYLKFMERARTEWLRSFGHDQRTLRERSGILFVVTRLEVRYRHPARLDDELQVTLQAGRTGRAGFDLAQRIERGGESPLCTASVRLACLHAGSMKPHRIPDYLLQELQGDH
jgi:acyl-CoA thioester hydrolase